MVLRILLLFTGLVALAVFLAFAIVVIQYLCWSRLMDCGSCHHYLEYKGFEDDSDGGHYLFHCPHCGAWKRVPTEEFFRATGSIDNINDL